MNYLKFKNKIDPTILTSIKFRIWELIKADSFDYGLSNRNRGMFPGKDRGSFSKYFPVESDQLLSCMFGNIPKTDYLKRGVFHLYFSTAAPDTYLEIHVDNKRRCAINFNLAGCDGLGIEFYRSLSNSSDVVIPKSDTELIDSVVLGYDDIMVMDTKVYHGVDIDFVRKQDTLLLSYGFPNLQDEESFEQVVERLRALDLV